MRSVELFAGAGGLALGVSEAGFSHELVVEWNRAACETIRENKKRKLSPVIRWNLHEGDVRAVDLSKIPPGIDLIAAGPPCQPFSLGGKHRGQDDNRDMFPDTVRVVRELQPKVVLIENVRGLLRESFNRYFSYIVLQLSYPELTLRSNEDWFSHLARLERYHTTGKTEGLHYRVIFRAFNAADYGVPQSRHRVMIVGFRSDINANWTFPLPTHSHEALLWDQWVTGEYWDRHGIAKRHRPKASARLASRLELIRDRLLPPLEHPWRTVRDAISSLPEPTTSDSSIVHNHRLNPGARAYAGHTGSPLDEPAKALKAGVHGVPGGENMLNYGNGRVRYFTVRESARLQTFPDGYVFSGAWSEAMRQLGNAVPVRIAHMVASSIAAKLSNV